MCTPQTGPEQSCVPLAWSQKRKASSQNTAQLRLLKSRDNHKRRAGWQLCREREGKQRRLFEDPQAGEQSTRGVSAQKWL